MGDDNDEDDNGFVGSLKGVVGGAASGVRAALSDDDEDDPPEPGKSAADAYLAALRRVQDTTKGSLFPAGSYINTVEYVPTWGGHIKMPVHIPRPVTHVDAPGPTVRMTQHVDAPGPTIQMQRYGFLEHPGMTATPIPTAESMLQDAVQGALAAREQGAQQAQREYEAARTQVAANHVRGLYNAGQQAPQQPSPRAQQQSIVAALLMDPVARLVLSTHPSLVPPHLQEHPALQGTSEIPLTANDDKASE